MKLTCWSTLALDSPPGHCHVTCLHPNQAHSVTPTLLITKTTKRENGSLLQRLIRPARSPKSLPHQSPPTSLRRDISNKLRSEIKELDVMLMDATAATHRRSNQHQANLPGIKAETERCLGKIRSLPHFCCPPTCLAFLLLGTDRLPHTQQHPAAGSSSGLHLPVFCFDAL